MKYSSHDLAHALYVSARDFAKHHSETDASEVIRGYIERAEKGAFGPALKKAAKELPQAAKIAEGIQDVLIESAFELSDSAAAKMLAALGIDPKAADVTRRVAPELIGGARVRTKDMVFDATVRGKLEQLRKAMKR